MNQLLSNLRCWYGRRLNYLRLVLSSFYFNAFWMLCSKKLLNLNVELVFRNFCQICHVNIDTLDKYVNSKIEVAIEAQSCLLQNAFWKFNSILNDSLMLLMQSFNKALWMEQFIFCSDCFSFWLKCSFHYFKFVFKIKKWLNSWTNSRIIIKRADGDGSQCDQIGQFIGLWATFEAFGNN